MNIYLLPKGDKLTDPLCFTPGIHAYLECERELVQQLCWPYATIVEACCSDGRYASIIAPDQRYIGIDMAMHHIQAAEEKHTVHNTTFVCADINTLDVLLANLNPGPDSIIIFPFNAFGNFHNPLEIFEMLQEMGIHFLICTYTTDEKSIIARSGYYDAAGFKNLSVSEIEGIRFTNKDGLDSIAYYESWFEAQFKSYGFKYRSTPFDDIGMAYMNF